MSSYRFVVRWSGFLLSAFALTAADSIKTKSTYKEAYGESKAPLAIDPAKDLPHYPAVEPIDAVATWQIKKGFKMEFAAHEPQLRSPVAVSFDEHGRMFVCEMIDYSEMRDVTPHLGRISMLEDKDGDGYYETSTVFADNLPWPTGLICANGGVYVIATPDIYFFKDTRGTGKADVREVIYTGFGTGLKILNVQGLANCPQWGLDNRIHVQAGGGNRGKVKCLKRPDLPEVELGGRDFWFDPRTLEFGLEAGGAQYGMSFDNYGRKFACSNSDHLQFFAYDDRNVARNAGFSMPPPRQSIAADGGAAEVYRLSPDEPWRIIRTRWRIAGVVKGMVEGGGRVSGYFTGATGTTVYRGDAYGEEFVNNTFTGDAGGQLIHRKKLSPNGVSLVGRRPDDEQNFEFGASKDTWVRVVNFANAPDGCLYTIDMYREVIEHPWSIPDEIKKHLDLNNGNNRGRIYRIAPARSGRKQRTKVRLDEASTEDLVKTLEHPNGWHRDCASRLLYERNDRTAVPLLEKMAAESKSATGRLHALCALDGFGAIAENVLLQSLGDQDEHVRENALVHVIALAKVKATGGADGGLANNSKLWDAVSRLADDESPRVRFHAALAAGFRASSQRAPVLAKLARRDSKDSWIAAAILNGADAELFLSLRQDLAGLDASFGERLVGNIAATAKTPKTDAALLEVITSGRPQVGMIRALAEGLKRAGSSLEKVDREKKMAAIFDRAAETTGNANVDEKARCEAISLLEVAPLKQASPALIAALEKAQPDSVQAAALRALGQTTANESTAAILAHWSNYGAKARDAALSALLSRPDRTLALLNVIQQGVNAPIKSADLSASQVQNLLKHQDKKVAELAKTALASVIPPSRESVIKKFQPALSGKGDVARGQLVYTQRCLACHRANNLGVQVGPDLVTVKTKGREGIFLAILDPNKEVAPQYIAYTVETRDGQTLVGMITNDSATSVTVKIMGGAEITIPRGNIKGMHASGNSLMPEGIEAGVSTQELTDLLDFIESLK